MSVPTIASVTPATGTTRGGNIVVIAGTNFRLPPPPPATGYLGGPAQRTVAVAFEGVAAPWAEAATSSLIYARVPTWGGLAHATTPAALDVRVANLDDAGVEIPGEAVVRADAYTVNRPILTAECYLMRVLRALIQHLGRHLVPRVSIAVGRDYDPNAADWERLRADAPCLQLFGPRMPLDRFRSVNRMETESLGGTAWALRRVPVTVDLDLQVMGWAATDSTNAGLTAIYALTQAFLLTMRDLPWLAVPIDPAQPSLGNADHDIEVPWDAYPTIRTEPNPGDLYNFESRIEIRGVHIDDESGTIIERGWTITANDGEPTVDLQGGL